MQFQIFLNFTKQSLGLVELHNWQLPGQLPNDPTERRTFLQKFVWQKRRSEVVPYNECFYNNMYNFKFVLPIDIDEIIFPITFDNWNDLMAYVYETDPKAEATVGSFAVRNAHFFKQNSSDVTDGTLMTVDTIERSANVSKPGIRVKSFVNTQVKANL